MDEIIAHISILGGLTISWASGFKEFGLPAAGVFIAFLSFAVPMVAAFTREKAKNERRRTEIEFIINKQEHELKELKDTTRNIQNELTLLHKIDTKLEMVYEEQKKNRNKITGAGDNYE